ncbi:HigA family addiction module antitoxin [Mycobacteroides franklinii]|uniref:HigA family addiction module antitoxin n=1 Tax=Mycobacteroides franklinii TaxID=948102 RepID=UPI0009946548|nr:HigA family addiction module antitoxin [Mycobacteroides franklinii]
MSGFAPIHPGEILATEFLDPLGITPYALAKAMRVPQTRIGEILKGKRAVTVETALRLSRALGTSEMFWVNLQARYDAEAVKDAEHDDLDRIPVLA